MEVMADAACADGVSYLAWLEAGRAPSKVPRIDGWGFAADVVSTERYAYAAEY